MTSWFHATCIEFEDNGELICGGFADSKTNTGDFLAFTRPHVFSDEDRRHGMDKVHVERNEQGHSGYGGMERVELHRSQIRVIFDEKGTRRMAGFSETRVTFDISEERFEQLRRELARVFAGFDYYADCTR